MRTVPRLGSSPTDTSPKTIPRLTLSRRTFPRTDISLNGPFPDRTLPRLYISPLGHFPDRTFPRPAISLTTCFSEIFLFKAIFFCTRIYQTVIQSCDLDQLKQIK